MNIVVFAAAAVILAGIAARVAYRFAEQRIRREYAIDSRIDAAHEQIGETYRTVADDIQQTRRDFQKSLDELEREIERKFDQKIEALAASD